MATADFDLRAKIAQQDAALQAMAQHLEKFKDFELESSVKITEELAQALEAQNQFRLRNESLIMTVENQAHTIELLLLKRAELLGELEQAHQYSNRLQTDFEEQLRSGEAACAVLEKQLGDSKSELDAAQTTIHHLRAQVDSGHRQLIEERTLLEERCSTFQKEAFDLSARLKTAESLNEKLSSELEQNQSLLEEFEERAVHLKSEVSAVHSDLDKLTIEYNKACTNLSSVQLEREQYSTENARLTSDLEKLTIAYNEASANASTLQSKCEHYSNNNALLTSQLEKLTIEYNKACSDLRSAQLDCEHYSDDNARLTSDLDKLRSEYEKACADLSSVQSDCNHYSNDNARLTSDLDKLRSEYEKACADLSSVQSECEHYSTATARLNSDLEKLRTEYNKACTDFSSVQSDCERYSDDNARLSSDLEKLQTEYEQACTGLLSLQSDWERCSNDNERLSSDLEKLRIDYNKTRTDLSSVQLEYERCCNDKVRLSSDLEKLRTEYNKACTDLTSAQSEGGRYSIMKEQLTSDLEKLKIEYDKACTDLSSVLLDCERYSIENSRLTSELEKLTSELNEANANSSIIQSKCERYSNDNVRLSAQLDQLASEYNKACASISSFQSDCQQFSNANARITADLEIATTKVKEISEKVHLLKSDHSELKEICSRYQDEALFFTRKLHVCVDKCKALSATIAELKTQNRCSSSECESLGILLQEKDHALQQAERKLEDSQKQHLEELSQQSDFIRQLQQSIQTKTSEQSVPQDQKDLPYQKSDIDQNDAENVKQSESGLSTLEEDGYRDNLDLFEIEQVYMQELKAAEAAIRTCEAKCLEEIESIRSKYELDLKRSKRDMESLKIFYEEKEGKLKEDYETQLQRVRDDSQENFSVELQSKDRLIKTYSGQLEEKEELLRLSQDQYEQMEAQLCELQQAYSKRIAELEHSLAISESRCLKEADALRSLHEQELSDMRREMESREVAYREQVKNLKQHYDSNISLVEDSLRERCLELEAENETMQSKITELEQLIAKNADSKQSESQLVSELETSLLEIEQLYIVNSALKTAQNHSVEDARRYQARIKELSSGQKDFDVLVSKVATLQSQLEAASAKVEKLCAVFLTLPKTMEKSVQALESSVSDKTKLFAIRLQKNAHQISLFKKAFAKIRAHTERERRGFEENRNCEQAEFERIIARSQSTIQELLCSRAQLEHHIADLSKELSDVNLKLERANECLARELWVQDSIKSLFESLQFQTVHAISLLQHEAHDLALLARTQAVQISDLEGCIQKFFIKLNDLSQSETINSRYIQVVPITEQIVSRPRNDSIPRFNHGLLAEVAQLLKSCNCLSDLQQHYIPLDFSAIFAEISRIVNNETLELKSIHEQVVDSLLKKIADRTGIYKPLDQISSNCSDDFANLSRSFHQILKTIETAAYPLGRFDFELQQLSDLFGQLASVNANSQGLALYNNPQSTLQDVSLCDGRRCERCGNISYVPIYCHSCSRLNEDLNPSVTEQTTALQQWNQGRQELQNEATQLRSCLNKAAATITELEIRLQEEKVEKSRLMEDLDRVYKEKEAYSGLLQESQHEIHHLEEVERDLRNAHRSFDEELHKSKVMLIGEGRVKQIFSRRLRNLQETLSLTRAELEQYKMDVARLDTLNKQLLCELGKAQEVLCSQSVQIAAPMTLENQISLLEKELSASQLQLSEVQKKMASYQSELNSAQAQNELLKRTLNDVNATIGRGLRGVLRFIPQAKVFVVEYLQGEQRALSNQYQSLLKLISLDRNSVVHLQKHVSDLQEKELIQSQALARAGRQLKEFQIVLSAQSTQIQSLKHQLKQSEINASNLREQTAKREISFKRLTSERERP